MFITAVCVLYIIKLYDGLKTRVYMIQFSVLECQSSFRLLQSFGGKELELDAGT